MPFYFVSENWKQKVIALAGFGMELFAIPIFYAFTENFGFWYFCVAGLHFGLYSFYAGEDSDFSWVI
jgi:hypothetical protein